MSRPLEEKINESLNTLSTIDKLVLLQPITLSDIEKSSDEEKNIIYFILNKYFFTYENKTTYTNLNDIPFELVSKYPILLEKYIFENEMKNQKNEDKKSFILNYPKNTFVTLGKSNLLYSYCGIISDDMSIKKLEEKILKLNGDDSKLDYKELSSFCYFSNDVIKLMESLEKSVDEMSSICEFLTVTRVDNLIKKKNLKIKMVNITKFIEYILDKLQDKNSYQYNSLYLKYNAMMYNNTRDTKYSEIVYNYQISNYAKNKNIISFHDICMLNIETKKLDALEKFIENEWDIFLELSNSPSHVNKALFIGSYMIQNSRNTNLNKKIYALLDNEFTYYKGKQDNVNFILQNYRDNTRCLKNEHDKPICLICLDEINNKVIMCMKCNKYISHLDCFKQYKEIKCFYCQK